MEEYNEYNAVISKTDSSFLEDEDSKDSHSTNDLFYKFEMIEEEIGSFLDSATEENQNFMLICEWEGCEESFPLSQNPLFLHHMQQHVHEETDRLLSGETDRFVCLWKGCTRRDQGIREELEFARHLLYHPFHQKLKVKGLVALRAHKIYVPCQIDDSLRNLVPDFPNTILCQWADCSFKCNCITSFDDHVRFHVYEQRFCEDTENCENVGNHPGKRRKTFYHCRWRGCPNFSSNDILQVLIHTQTHTNLRQYACARCGALFCTKEKFLDHHRRQATVGSGFILDSIIYQCTYCKKKYPSETILRNHMRSHIYNYMCQYCNNTFSKASGLRKHIIYRHRKERKFACQNKQCDYRAKDRYDLQKHVERSHSEREVFQCKEGECRYTCLNEHTLQLHLKNKHSGSKKNYMCHVCNKKFGEGRTLSRHLVHIHDYSRPHGASKFRYSCEPDGFYRLQRVKYESQKLVAIKEIRRKAESSLLALGVDPNTNMDLVIRTDSGEEQQLKFVSYRNALRELNNESQSDDGLLGDYEEEVDVESPVCVESDSNFSSNPTTTPITKHTTNPTTNHTTNHTTNPTSNPPGETVSRIPNNSTMTTRNSPNRTASNPPSRSSSRSSSRPTSRPPSRLACFPDSNPQSQPPVSRIPTRPPSNSASQASNKSASQPSYNSASQPFNTPIAPMSIPPSDSICSSMCGYLSFKVDDGDSKDCESLKGLKSEKKEEFEFERKCDGNSACANCECTKEDVIMP